MSIETQEEKDPAMNIETTQIHLFSRQPPTALERIAFWAFLVGGLGGLAGAIALTIVSGSPSLDIVITTVVGLASAAILATRFREVVSGQPCRTIARTAGRLRAGFHQP